MIASQNEIQAGDDHDQAENLTVKRLKAGQGSRLWWILTRICQSL